MNTRLHLLVCLLASAGLAQQPDVTPDFEAFKRAQQLQQQALQKKREEERLKNLPTIKQNAADYESPDPEIRRRAVLILGKYKRDPLARMILKRALKDPESAVRQGSLVALIEPYVDTITANSMLLLINDVDVSIRRICSAALPSILPSYGGGIANVINGKVVREPLKLPGHLKQRLQAAHKDSDEIVRKNVVDVWSLMPTAVDEKTAVAMLKDPSRDVRISALDQGNRVMGNEAYGEAIKGLVDDEDKLVRLRLAAILSSGVISDSRKSLTALTKDTDFDVSNTALLGLMSHGQKEAWETLKGRFSDGRMKTDTATKAIGYLNRLGDYGRTELKAFLSNNRTAFRAAAAQTLTRTPSVELKPETTLKLLSDSNSDVRKAGAMFLHRDRKLAAEHINDFVTSPYKDVRLMAVSQAVLLRPKQRETVLFDLFLDNNVDVRCRALEYISSLRVDGWLQLLTDALDDEEDTVQENAVNLLLRSANIFPGSKTQPGEGRRILLNYLNTGKDETLKAHIRQRVPSELPPARPLRNP